MKFFIETSVRDRSGHLHDPNIDNSYLLRKLRVDLHDLHPEQKRMSSNALFLKFATDGQRKEPLVE